MKKISQVIQRNYRFMLAIIMAFFLGGLFFQPSPGDQTEHQDSASIKAWTCSMHPNINLPESGQCPICFMDLIPLEYDESGTGLNQISLSKEAVQLANIQTIKVNKAIPTKQIQLSGKIAYDESRISNITAWVSGRLERMFVDYTGIRVQKGDHMMKLYSPDLYAGQEELIQAKRHYILSKSSGKLIEASAKSTLNAVREKIRLLGLSPAQIDWMEAQDIPSPIVEIKSPMTGIVIKKNGVEGDYIKPGTRIYTIADLDHLWAVFDAYESDLSWLALGQKVDFTTESYPGRHFHGSVGFIHPILTEKTRTIQVRVNVENKDGELKPGMFVNGTVFSNISSRGKAINSELAGKWVCPMHPDIVQDEKGTCSICNMDLVSADSLGIVHAEDQYEGSLLIPASAVLRTGAHAIVYVRLPGDTPIFESRIVELGVKVGSHYIIKSGLKEGESVVLNGNFKIDSAMQISGKNSMMNNDQMDSIMRTHSEKGEKAKVTHEVNSIMNSLIQSYFILQTALANDDNQKAIQSLSSLSNQIPSFSILPKGITGENAYIWKRTMKSLTSVGKLKSDSTIKSIRTDFKTITQHLITLDSFFEFQYQTNIFEVFCPMAYNNIGASWLSQKNEVQNPYFGATMLKCGTVKRQLGHE